MVLGAAGHEGAAGVVVEMTCVDGQVAVLDPSRSFKVGECLGAERMLEMFLLSCFGRTCRYLNEV